MTTEKYTSTKIACYTGYFVQAIVNNLAPLFYVIFQKEFGLSYKSISWLILLNFVTQIFVDVISVKIIPKLGYRTSVILAHICASSGLILLGILPRAMSHHYVGLIIPVIIYATGSGLIEVLISPIIEGLPLDNKSGQMSLLHSFYCWGQAVVVLVTTFIIKFAGSENWWFIPFIWALIPFVNIFAFARVPIFPPVPEGENEMKTSEILKEPVFIIFALLMVCSGASEIALAQWASTFAENSLHVSKLTGDLLGPCMFALLMASGRVAYGFIGDRLDIRKALSVSAALCAASYITASFCPGSAAPLIGCAICGLSVALMWPGVFSLSAKHFPKGGTPMFAMLAMFGDIGCSLGPWTAGIVSDLIENSTLGFNPLKCGLLVCTVFPIIMIALLNIPKALKTSQIVH
ncbi:MAG: MFS transporter [Clostridia bacterium]|nr:MFS transporter [Clostridia bacterium]